MRQTIHTPQRTRAHLAWPLAGLLGLGLAIGMGSARASEPAAPKPPEVAKPVPPAAPASVSATQGKVELPLKSPLANQLRDTISQGKLEGSAQVTVPKATDSKAPAQTAPRPVSPSAFEAQRAKALGLPVPSAAAKAAARHREEERLRTAAMTGHTGGHGDVHWGYEGATGPESWGRLKPEFAACAKGQRQSPIHIQDGDTLIGPAEPLQFRYQASGGSVVHNGHTIQVDVEGDNTLTVRGSVYRLVQFHFHHPSEERVNQKGFAMVAHLVHKNDAGQLAVVAVLMDPGAANPLVRKVWTHMPLDAQDRLRLPAGLIDLNELLPADQRYYQFMGSLTTPPCTEGVLWMVLKGVQTLSREQLKMFTQLFPNNARPTQPLNKRPVREAE